MRRAKRRAVLLQSALEVFAEQGYHAASITDIIKRANVARGTFYLYFEGKRAVFELLLDDVLKSLGNRVTRIDTSRGPAGVLAQMEANVDGVFSYLLANRPMLRVLLAEAVGLDAGFDQKLAEFYGRLTQMIQDAIELGKQMRIVSKRINTSISALCILGSIKEVLYQVSMGSKMPSQQIMVDELLRYTVHALLVPEMAKQMKF